MKIAAITIRTLMGLVFLMTSVIFFFHLYKQPEMTGPVKVFNEGVAAAVYLFPLIKIVEVICSIAFITGRYVTLAAVVIFPNIVNILLFHAFLEPSGLPLAIFLLIGDLFLAYYYRKNYTTLFAAK
jgi:putative oxidoreductase